MAKQNQSATSTASTRPSHLQPVPSTPAPTPIELAKIIREYGSVESALAAIRPARPRREMPDPILILNESQNEALPKGGAPLKIFSVAALLGPGTKFRGSELEASASTNGLGGVKQIARWVRRLTKTGHFVEAS